MTSCQNFSDQNVHFLKVGCPDEFWTSCRNSSDKTSTFEKVDCPHDFWTLGASVPVPRRARRASLAPWFGLSRTMPAAAPPACASLSSPTRCAARRSNPRGSCRQRAGGGARRCGGGCTSAPGAGDVRDFGSSTPRGAGRVGSCSPTWRSGHGGADPRTASTWGSRGTRRPSTEPGDEAPLDSILGSHALQDLIKRVRT